VIGKEFGTRRPRPVLILAVLLALGLCGAGALAGCAGSTGSSTTAGATTTTVGPGITMGTETTARSSADGGAGGTDATAAPSTSDPKGPTTTVFTGTTGPGGRTRSLTNVGPMSAETWQALRAAVIAARGDGQKVLDEVAKLSAGAAVDVSTAELDALSGIGYSAGANTTQPIAVATDGNAQVLVFAFTVTGQPASTTIVGFNRNTGHVALVAGPLPVSDSTQNITTIPGQ
jgi:hypothetical protein